MQFMSIVEAIELIQMEYAEMPELRLTFLQARRLWNFSEELCERALRELLASGFLGRTPDGSYVRRGASPSNVGMGASLVCESGGAIT
jgi:hypothetical protein